MIASVIASATFTLAGDSASAKSIHESQPLPTDESVEDTKSKVFRLLCITRLLQGLCHGTISLTQQAYIGQTMTKDNYIAL